jgi:RimJ/RimL family protein N-acetyltransferase
LTLRPLAPADARDYCDLYTDPETMRHIGPQMTLERAQSSFASALRSPPTRRLFLAVQRQSSQEFLGICALQNFETDVRRAEIGIMLNKRGRGHHISREAFRATMLYAFDVLAIEELKALIAKNNLCAQRLCYDLGFALSHSDSEQCVMSAHRGAWQDSRL